MLGSRLSCPTRFGQSVVQRPCSAPVAAVRLQRACPNRPSPQCAVFRHPHQRFSSRNLKPAQTGRCDVPKRSVAKFAVIVFAACPDNPVVRRVIARRLHDKNSAPHAADNVATRQQIQQRPPVGAFVGAWLPRVRHDAQSRAVITSRQHGEQFFKRLRVVFGLVIRASRLNGSRMKTSGWKLSISRRSRSQKASLSKAKPNGGGEQRAQIHLVPLPVSEFPPPAKVVTVPSVAISRIT